MNIFSITAKHKAKIIIAQLPNTSNMMITVINDGCCQQKQVTPQWVNDLQPAQHQQFIEDLITKNIDDRVKLNAEKPVPEDTEDVDVAG